MYLLSDILKSLPKVTNPRLILSGFGVWVLWRNKAGSTTHQTLTRFGGIKISVGSNQSLWYFQNAQVFPALARMLLWTQVHPESVLSQVLPAKLILGESNSELTLSISNQLAEQKITPGESFDVWVHPDVIRHVSSFPGLGVEQRPPMFGMTPVNWYAITVDPGFSLDADLGWFFFIKPMQDKESENYVLRWKNFYMRQKSILDRLGIRYIYQDNLLFFKIDGLNQLSSWIREILSTIAHIKFDEPDSYWPCLYCAVQSQGLSFNDELPTKTSIAWDRLAPDTPHLPLSTGLLLRDEFAITFLDAAGELPLDSLCQLGLSDGESPEQRRVDFPSSASLSAGKKTPCFYCGMKSHESSQCPSRQIFNPEPGVWDKVGGMGIKDLAQAVKALDKTLGNGNLANISELLLAEGPEHTFLKAVFEINCPAQHRMMRMVWRSRGKELPDGLRHLNPPEGEYVWSALENTRSSNYAQAERMMQQAIMRTSKSYQPHVLLGFIALETGNPRKTEGHWKNAQNLCYTPLQQGYMLFLKARLLEVQGSYDQAHQSFSDSLRYSPRWLEPRYRQAVCLTKKGFLDQAWTIFADLIIQEPHIFNRILFDHELERGRSFLLSALSGPWNTVMQRAKKEQDSIQQLRTKLETWFVPDNQFRKNIEERAEILQKSSQVDNYVSFTKVAEVTQKLQGETDRKIKEAVASLNKEAHKNIERAQAIFEEIAYFPFPKLIRKTNRDYNQAGRILQRITKSDLRNGNFFRQATMEMKDANDILDRMDKRIKKLVIFREGTLFFLFLSKTFLWLAMFGLLASIIAVPVLLSVIQESGSIWATEWMTTQRWQVQRTVSMLMILISGVIAALWTTARYAKTKQKYLAKAKKKRRH
jgi:tetratricopeptide (TPR) repeat protein